MKKILFYSVLVISLICFIGIGLAYANGFFHKGEGKEAMFEHKASILGLTVDELKAKLAEKKGFRWIAEEEDITFEQMHEKKKEITLERVQEHLIKMVEAGKITQTEADDILQKKIDWFDNFQGKSHGKGFFGGFGKSFSK